MSERPRSDFGAVLLAWRMGPGDYAALIGVDIAHVWHWRHSAEDAYSARGLPGETNRAMADIYRDKPGELERLHWGSRAVRAPEAPKVVWYDRARLFTLIGQLR